MLKGKTILGSRYQIVKTLGQGGMGAVYLAEDQRLPTKWAIKGMKREGMSPQEVSEATTLFRTEARLLSELRHRNLPRIVDFFDEDDELYLVMDYIEGETLESHLDKDGPLTLSLALDLCLQISDVLDYLHSRAEPIIFRDFKPGNVMLTAQNEVKLIDFGIARIFNKDKNSDTKALGTPGYAAPEQYGKGQSGPQTDLYAFAATMHHALSGRDPTSEPFNFPPLTNYRQDLPSGLVSLLESCLQLKASERPESAFAVKRQLEQIIKGQSNSSTLSGRATTQELASAAPPEENASSTQPIATASPTLTNIASTQLTTQPINSPAPSTQPVASTTLSTQPKVEATSEKAVANEANISFTPPALNFKKIATGYKESLRLRIKTSQSITLTSSTPNIQLNPSVLKPGSTSVLVTIDGQGLEPNTTFQAAIGVSGRDELLVPVEANILSSQLPLKTVIGAFGLALASLVPIAGYFFTATLMVIFLKTPVSVRKSLRGFWYFSLACTMGWTIFFGVVVAGISHSQALWEYLHW